MLVFDDVTVRFGAQTAVDRVNMPVCAGSWLGIIGPNGAGKSTLLRAASHLQPHEGRITWNGAALADLTHRQAARLVAYVPQQPELPAGMSVLSYVLLGRTPHIGYFGVESDVDQGICLDLLARLGLVDLVARDVTTLSGGEVQRVVLARALAQQAPILLLDEPTSALDIGNRVAALDLVDEMRHELGLTVVAVMHDLTLAAQFSDELALIDGGRLTMLGEPVEVLREDVLQRSFGGQVRVIAGDDGTPVVVPMRANGRRAAGGRDTGGSQRTGGRDTGGSQHTGGRRETGMPAGAARPTEEPATEHAGLS